MYPVPLTKDINPTMRRIKETLDNVWRNLFVTMEDMLLFLVS
jgi:hypothetical protein